MNLTARQQRFVEEYLVDGNGARAARCAGYSENSARQMAAENLSKPYIQDSISEKRQRTADKLNLRKEQLLLSHLAAIRLAEAQGQPLAMISAAREIGRLMGFYGPQQVKVDVDAGETFPKSHFESLSDADLMAIVDGQ